MDALVLRPGRRHFGLQTMADQLLRAFPGQIEAADPYECEPSEMARLARGRTVISCMLDGVLPDFAEHVLAVLDTARRVVWAPMSEYLLPKGAGSTYPRFASVLSPTEQAHRWLTARAVASDLVPWWVAPASGRPDPGAERRVLHFSYGKLGYYKSGTDLVLAAWPRLERMGYSLTIKSRTPIDAPPGVRVVSDDLPDLGELWAAHGVFLTPYRRAGIGLPPQEALVRGLVALVTDDTAAAEFVPPAWRLPSAPDGGGRGLANWETGAGCIKDWERATTEEAIASAFERMDDLRAEADAARERAAAGHEAWREAWAEVLG